MIAISLSEEDFSWLRKKEPNEKWIAIRICSQLEELKYYSKSFNRQFEDILVSKFTDIEESLYEDGKHYNIFNQENYDEIIEFINKHTDCEKLFIHCHAGVCRSPGVAVGLAKKYDWIESKHGINNEYSVYPYPNVVSWFTTNEESEVRGVASKRESGEILF